MNPTTTVEKAQAQHEAETRAATPRTDQAVQDVRSLCAELTEPIAADFARELERENTQLRAGWDAACAFIDSHAADPDITADMCEKYADFLAKRSALTAAAPHLKP